jgi:hypothetical protein
VSYAEHKQRLAATVERYERLRADHDKRVIALREYARIDSGLLAVLPCAGLPDGEALCSAMEAVQQTLRRIDGGLRTALTEHQKRYETDRRLIEWDEPPADGVLV